MLPHSSILEKSHGQRSLVGYSPRGRKKSDTAERLSNNSDMPPWACKWFSRLNTRNVVAG